MKHRAWTIVACGLLVAAVGTGCGGGGDGVGGGTPPYTFQPASLVLGQPGFTTGAINRGQPLPAANSLAQPGAVATDGSYTVVADWGNDRVVGFLGVPQASDLTADFVVGQTDFTSGNDGLAADRLDSPRGVCMAQGRLYVADSRNNRVLIWNSVPLTNQPADQVLGQVGFTTNVPGVGPGGMFGPTGLMVVGGRLLVADSGNNRVLVWNTLPAANGAPADMVLGQPDFITTTAAATQSRMAWPRDVWSDGVRLVVSDSSNNRVLIWNGFPAANGAAADLVLGQGDFVSNADAAGPGGLSYTGGITSDGERLFVLDTGNDRLLVYDPFPTQSGAEARVVLGQSDFWHTTQNDDDQDGTPDGGPSARTVYSPGDVEYFAGRLYVTDFHNSRVLVYVAP